MPVIHLIAHDGTAMPLQVPEGHSVMQAAVAAGLRGIIGECGGAAMCGTCHVFVDEAWLDRLPPISINEDDLLDGTATERRPNSRLGCQIRMTSELEGLELQLPASQR